jgi:hypothetical protein
MFSHAHFFTILNASENAATLFICYNHLSVRFSGRKVPTGTRRFVNQYQPMLIDIRKEDIIVLSSFPLILSVFFNKLPDPNLWFHDAEFFRNVALSNS